MTATLVPIFVCVVLPIAVVLITSLTKMNNDNKRTQIIIKAIEANKDVDTDKLIESLKKPRKTAAEIRNTRLLLGCIFSLIGLCLVIVGIVNWLATDVDAYLDIDTYSDAVAIPLVFGGMSMAVGISYLIVYFVTRKQSTTNTEEN